LNHHIEPTATAEEIAFAKALEADVEPLIATIVALGDKSAEAGRALLLAAIALCEIARRETHDDAFMDILVGKALAAGQAYSRVKRMRRRPCSSEDLSLTK